MSTTLRFKLFLILLVAVVFNVYAGFMLNEELRLTGFPEQKSILALKLEEAASLPRTEPTFSTPNAACNYLGAQLGGVLAGLEKEQCIIIATGKVHAESGDFVARVPVTKALLSDSFPVTKVIPAKRIVSITPYDNERTVIAPFLIACYFAIMALIGWLFSRLLKQEINRT